MNVEFPQLNWHSLGFLVRSLDQTEAVEGVEVCQHGQQGVVGGAGLGGGDGGGDHEQEGPYKRH